MKVKRSVLQEFILKTITILRWGRTSHRELETILITIPQLAFRNSKKSAEKVFQESTDPTCHLRIDLIT